MTKSSIDRKRSRYGEKFSLRFHKPLRIYQLSCSLCEPPYLIANFVETDGDLAIRLWEMLEGYHKESEQLRKDLIDHSALIRMLEDYKALCIEDILWNVTGVESEEEFNELFKPYLDNAKEAWE